MIDFTDFHPTAFALPLFDSAMGTSLGAAGDWDAAHLSDGSAGLISYQPDRRGTNHATATTTARPTIRLHDGPGGHPWADFDGSTDSLTMGSVGTSGSFTVYMVARFDSNSIRSVPFCSNKWALEAHSDGKIYYIPDVDGGRVGAGVSYAANIWYLLTWQHTVTTNAYRYGHIARGVQTVATGTTVALDTGTPAGTPNHIGSYNPGFALLPLDGGIARVLYYPEAHTDRERANIERSLCRQYGIQAA